MPDRVLAVIPARGGSKGLLRKNLVPVAGRPLVARAVDCALHARLVHRVIVSTDDAEIAAVAANAGAEVVRRPAELSGDEASSESALLHALDDLARTERYQPDIVAFLQCTSPLTEPEDVDGTINALLASNADCAFAVSVCHSLLWKQNTDGQWIGVNHDPSNRRPRQLCEPEFRETGAVYAMKTEGFLRARARFFGRIVAYVMPPSRSIEIDEPWDVQIAETLIRERHRPGTLDVLPKRLPSL